MPGKNYTKKAKSSEEKMSPLQRRVKKVENKMGKPVTFEGRAKAKADKKKNRK